ncbi:MAG: peptidylprolyl isomerase, partial [Candidatus Krumholzibacteriia bacterium]
GRSAAAALLAAWDHAARPGTAGGAAGGAARGAAEGEAEAAAGAGAEGAADVRLAVLEAFATMLARHVQEFAADDGHPVNVRGSSPVPTVYEEPGAQEPAADQLAAVAALLRAACDVADIRVRIAARETALATGLLPPELVPSAGSLRETLPPVVRSPEQPPLQLPFPAPRVRVHTPRGAFTIDLDGQVAPNTTATFLALARKGFYDDLGFHRVVPDFVIQGGDPRDDGWGGPGFTIRSEWSRIPFERGTVGIAHSGKDTGGSQFFVTLSAQPHLNGRYTVFGRVVEGMEAVDRVQPGDRFRVEVLER